MVGRGIATTLIEDPALWMRSMPAIPCDGHMLAETLEQDGALTGCAPTTAIVDKGYCGVEVDGVRTRLLGQRCGVSRTL